MRFDESQFIESLNGIPVEDLFRAIEQECRRIENSLLPEQPPPDQSTVSILIFRRFINAVMLDVRLTHHVLPAEHLPAYREAVARLVEAGRLPPEANEEFGKTFSAAKSDCERVKRADAAFVVDEKRRTGSRPFDRPES